MTDAKPPVCDNPDHSGLPTAVARVSWPDARFNSSLACSTCIRHLIFSYVRGADSERHPMLLTPLQSDP
jgi:hypothetical protein